MDTNSTPLVLCSNEQTGQRIREIIEELAFLQMVQARCLEGIVAAIKGDSAKARRIIDEIEKEECERWSH